MPAAAKLKRYTNNLSTAGCWLLDDTPLMLVKIDGAWLITSNGHAGWLAALHAYGLRGQRFDRRKDALRAIAVMRELAGDELPPPDVPEPARALLVDAPVIGARMRALRQQRGVSAAALAADSDGMFDEADIHRIEDAGPGSSYAFALYQQAFDVSFDDLAAAEGLTAAERLHLDQQDLCLCLESDFVSQNPESRNQSRDRYASEALAAAEQAVLDAWERWAR